MNPISAFGTLTLVSLAALFGSGCAMTSVPSDGAAAMPAPGSSEVKTPTGAELFTMIAQDDPYQQWAQFADHVGTQPSALPHGPMSRVFINSVVESAIDSFDGELPNGSIIVKENVGTSPAVTEAVLTVMWKVTGFDSDHNDWFWANMSLDGQITAEGQIAACAACHSGARANDFVFVHQF